ncbi:MAG: sigma-70 family RNA polymerase sigma factor, partial [Acetatifactor sp.]|nr:sigma-70 family RNA polymerase sigma factor [Acetatifactor sp.]
DGEEYEKAWLIRVTLNGCRKIWRNGFYRRRSDDVDPEKESETGDCSPEEVFLDKERARTVMEAVWRLPTAYREVIHLFYYEELSVKEIALILERKISTVTSQLTRGREMLKRSLKEEYDFA